MPHHRPKGLARRARRLPRDERGAAVVEGALLLPFMVFLGLGVFEYGHMLYDLQLMHTGVADAARYLARVPAPSAAEADARRLAVTGSIVAGKPARVRGWTTETVQVAYETTANPRDHTTGLRLYRGGDTLTVVHVSTTMTYQGPGIIAALGLGNGRIGAAHEERYVGD